MTHTRVYVNPTVHVTGILSSNPSDTLNRKTYLRLLTDRRGDPRPDGMYRLTFRLYDNEEDGMTFWSEIQPVELRLGMFSVVLGLQVPFELPFDKEYWLSIQVEEETELAERISLSLAGYEKKERQLSREMTAALDYQ